MKTITVSMIRSWNPCYDPTKYLPEDFKGNVLDILDNKDIPFQDRLWVIFRKELVSEKLMRVFAVWCARQVQHLMKDQRSIDALDFMDAYIENYWLIDDLEWQEGWNDDRAAARDAAGAAWAAWAARVAAWAARDAARVAAWAARVAAWGAARDAAWDAQEQKLREMLIQGVKTGDVK